MKKIIVLSILVLFLFLLLISCSQEREQESWTLTGPVGTEAEGVPIANLKLLQPSQVSIEQGDEWLSNEKSYQTYLVKSSESNVVTKNDSLPMETDHLGGRFVVNFIAPGDSISVYEAMLVAGHQVEMVSHSLGWYIININQRRYPHGPNGWKFWTRFASTTWEEVPYSVYNYYVPWGCEIAYQYAH